MREIDAEEVVRSSRVALGLPATNPVAVDIPFIAASIRRLASIYCPCSAKTLLGACIETVGFLTDPDTLEDGVSTTIENLIARGDLLELYQVVIDDPAVKATSLFPAPPSFVRRSGGVILLGVTPDEAFPLPRPLLDRIVFDDAARFLPSCDDEDLGATLRDLGLIELSQDQWLRAPRQQSADSFVASIKQRLHRQGNSGEIPNLQILDSEKNVLFYTGRWTDPMSRTGDYVARRLQAYGSPLWCYVTLKDGNPSRFIDFPFSETKLRGCDIAWHLQMAIDRMRNAPQQFRITSVGSTQVRFDFFSPLPAWAQRRFDLMATPARREKCLFSYLAADSDRNEHVQYLQTHLWLSPTSDSE